MKAATRTAKAKRAATLEELTDVIKDAVDELASAVEGGAISSYDEHEALDDIESYVQNRKFELEMLHEAAEMRKLNARKRAKAVRP